MAKVTRDNLPRGAELLKDHVFDPMTGMATALSGNVESEQLQCSKSTFRLNFSVPYISAKFFWANPGGWFYIPFCLPPLQEHWFSTTSVNSEYPVPVLTEVGFSFDQRSEPCLPADRYAGKAFDANLTSPEANYVSSIHEGKAVYSRAGNVDIKLAIFEKSQHFFSPQEIGSGSNWTAVKAPGAENEVFAATIPAAEISAKSSRNNPACYPGLSIPCSPKKTYMFAINADELVDPTSTSLHHTALVSVNISLKFKMPLVVRDSTVAGSPYNLQNVPTASYGARTSETISITAPSAGDVVSADAARGVSAELEKIDSRLRHKIYGGYQDFSSTYVGQHVKDDAGYEIIAVPMFSNTAFGEILARPCWLRMRDLQTTELYNDRITIPITSPMTIHHVLVTNNYLTATPYDAARGTPMYTFPPAAGKVRYQVGVGVVAGQAADNVDYTQVAYAEIIADNAAATGLVDFMDMGNFASIIKDVYRPQRWEQSIFAVPLVRGSVGGNGYVTQGRPFFVGEAAENGLDTAARAAVGDPTSAGSNITTNDGLEQFIEVRMRINPQVSVFDGSSNWQSNYLDWANFSGYGGSWVYIIGKKHMRT